MLVMDASVSMQQGYLSIYLNKLFELNVLIPKENLP